MGPRFEWDAVKADNNFKKHRVTFGTAIRVFSDQFALVEQDRFEAGEERWQVLGMVEGFLLLLVAFAVREDDDTEVIRIISARRAERHERRRYEQAYRET